MAAGIFEIVVMGLGAVLALAVIVWAASLWLSLRRGRRGRIGRGRGSAAVPPVVAGAHLWSHDHGDDGGGGGSDGGGGGD